jgi:hypothetical protein
MGINYATMQLEPTKLDEVIQAALDVAGECGGRDAKRWQTAIAKARQQLMENPFLHFDGDALLILSSESNNTYRANGTCSCKAYANGFPCCIARRLVLSPATTNAMYTAICSTRNKVAYFRLTHYSTK